MLVKTTNVALIVGFVGMASAAAAVCTPTVQWVWAGPIQAPGFEQTCVTPLVVQLTDDNGDGSIDTDDMPDVVFVHYHWDGAYHGRITAVDGLTGSEHFTITSPLVLPNSLAAGDIDGDGIVELIALDDGGGGVVVFEHTGALKWISDPSPVVHTTSDTVGIADLDQDGSPEIYTGATVFDALGRVRFSGTAGEGLEGSWLDANVTHAVDLLPANPGLELLAGRTLYDANGAILWDNTTVDDGWTAVADFDLDGDAEIVLTTEQTVHMLDHMGNELGPPHTITGRLISQPVIADLDGNGRPEVFVTNETEAQALRWSGSAFTVLWTQQHSDWSRVHGGAAFDFDGDGAAEIVYHDMDNWYIYDGTTGAILSSIPHSSATVIETPVIANIDNDCAAEILITSCRGGFSTSNRITAYECASSSSPRSIWNQFGYHVTNVNDDGTIPTVEAPPWQQQNSFIGQVGGGGGSGVTADAGPTIEVCAGDGAILDGSLSRGCAGTFQYRWLDGASVLCPWSSSPTCAVTPTASPAVYQVEVECRPANGCTGTGTDTDTVTVTMVPNAVADAGADASVCEAVPVIVDGGGSLDPGCPGGLLYEWRDGATTLRPASPDPTWSAPTTTVGPTTYTLVVTCAAGTQCPSTDEVVVEVRLCPLAVQFDSWGAAWQRSTTGARVIDLAWRTLSEQGTLGFLIESANTATGPYTQLEYVDAVGPGLEYKVSVAPPTPASWFRIVEFTGDGRGDSTPPFSAAAPVSRGGARDRSGRRTRRR